jgi:hypothetical protein
MKVTRTQLETGALSLEPASAGALATYVGEASTLGIAPGATPRLIDTDLGNGRPFVFIQADDEVAIYRQDCGSIDLHILND